MKSALACVQFIVCSSAQTLAGSIFESKALRCTEIVLSPVLAVHFNTGEVNQERNSACSCFTIGPAVEKCLYTLGTLAWWALAFYWTYCVESFDTLESFLLCD